MLRLGWGGVGWDDNVVLRCRHVLVLPTWLGHACLDITGKKQRRRMAPSRTQVEGELHIILPQVLLWMLIPHKLLQLLTSCFPLVLSVDLKKVALLVVRLLVKQNLSKHQGNCISGALLGNAKKDTMSLTFRCFAAHA